MPLLHFPYTMHNTLRDNFWNLFDSFAKKLKVYRNARLRLARRIFPEKLIAVK